MTRQYKCVFCDIDLTFLTDNNLVTEENIAAVKKMKENGVHFILNSGRMPFAMQQILQDIGFIGDSGEYILCANAAVISNCNAQIISKKNIRHEVVDMLIDLARDKETGLFLSSFDSIFCFNQSVIERNKVKKHVKLVELSYDEMKEFAQNDIYKISLIHPDYDYLESIRKEIQETMKDELTAVYSLSDTLELCHFGCNKGEGIKELCRFLNIDVKDTIAIGDNDNDLSMLRTAGFSACPSNAIKNVKDIVDYVATNDNNHSAFAEIIENCLFS